VLARQNLSYTKIYSPFDGQIGFNVYSVGNLVNQSSGTLATVVSIDPMRVEFVINSWICSNSCGCAPPGRRRKSRVAVLQDGVNKRRRGRIRVLSNRVDPRTGRFCLALFP
jgi:membrane fusion protein (multidrug efflux system)